jgi:hypothetical protein
VNTNRRRPHSGVRYSWLDKIYFSYARFVRRGAKFLSPFAILFLAAGICYFLLLVTHG